MPTSISSMSAVSASIDRTTTLLFKPFRLRHWLLLAVPAWLTTFGMGAGGVPTFLVDRQKLTDFLATPPTAQDLSAHSQKLLEEFNTYLQTHLTELILQMCAVATVAFLIYWLYMWLNARAQFLLLDIVTHPEPPAESRWKTFRKPGNALCNFFIKWDLFWLNIFLAILFVSLFFLSVDFISYIRDLHINEDGPTSYKISIFTWGVPIWAACSLIPLLIIFLLARATLFSLAIPIMYAKNLEPWPAYKYTLTHVVFPRLRACLIFFFFTFLATMFRNSLMSLAALLTCCILHFLSEFPLVGHLANYPLVLAALPAFLFLRLLSLDFLAQALPKFRQSLPNLAPQKIDN